MVKVNNLAHIPFCPPGSGQFDMFLTSVIEVDKREVLSAGNILSIFMCFCCFKISQENYPYAVKVNDFGSCPSFDPLDQANLICF